MRPRLGLFLSSNPAQGGTYQYSLAVLKALLALSDKCDIQIAYTDDSWSNILAKHGVTGQILPYQVHIRFIAALWREFNLSMKLWCWFAPKLLPIVRQLKAERCDVWLFPAQDCWGYQACVPALVTILDLMHRYERSFPEVSKWGRFQRLEHHYRSISRIAAGIVVDSERGRQHVLESYDPEPDKVFSLPYVPPSYLFEDNNVESALNGLPAKYIFYPAQFWAHKNHGRLLEAVLRLIQKIPDLHLVLVGEPKGAYHQVLKQISRFELEGRVTHFGYVSDPHMRILYCRARALIMPSFFGPTNIPPLEAMALGCPVAVSNNYAMPEQVGDAGLLFNPESVDDIAAAIDLLWNDDMLCADLSKRGIEKSRCWTQNHFNKRLEDIIYCVLGTSSNI